MSSSSGYPGSRRRSRRVPQQAAHSSEPLLSPGLDWPSSNSGARGPPARRRDVGGSVELTRAASAYRPPQTLSDLPIVDALNVVPRQQHQRQQRHTHLLPAIDQPNVNPAVDLAIPFFSHGCCCMQCVRTQEIGFIEQCGEFQEILGPGCYCMAWPVNTISDRLSLRIQQLEIVCETKTSDHVFVKMHVVILFRVALVRAYEAFYRLSHPHVQIETCVLDVVRSSVPIMTLDEVFVGRHEIAETLLIRLQQAMREYGFEISETLVTDVVPNDAVKAAMNEINASRRLKEAAPYKAEAARIEVVARAQAAAEGRYLSGVGLANQRRALARGLKESVETWTDDVRMLMGAKEVMDVVLLSQYIDVLTAVSSNNSSMILAHESGSTTS